MILFGALALAWLPIYYFWISVPSNAVEIYDIENVDNIIFKKFKYKNSKYVHFSKDFDEEIRFGTSPSQEFTRAFIEYSDKEPVVVTNKIIKLSGPNGNFYDKKVNFSKVLHKFFEEGSVLHLHSNVYGWVAIDLDTNIERT